MTPARRATARNGSLTATGKSSDASDGGGGLGANQPRMRARGRVPGGGPASVRC
jgi:hypothetical protein